MEFHVAEFVKLYTLLRDRGVDVWVDGGWGVDALLGEQTRSHRDLDLAVEARNEGGLRALLLSLGYADKPREDTSAWNYVLADAAGHEVDVHVITFDERGNGIYGPPEDGEMYPASALTGLGTIGGLQVRCIAAADRIKFHTGYEIGEKDYHDVAALSAKFGLALPVEYSRFRATRGLRGKAPLGGIDEPQR
jgi:lincosamide nucleotidyltransferase A/C/D/E